MQFTLLEQAKAEGGEERMKTAAIYCRVSTDNQEAEGTSLQTQLEACQNYCHGKGYEVAHRFSEAYSGLSLERPKLNELRELIRNEQIDLVVVHSLDRLSRDPVHGVIFTQELERHNIVLKAVLEDVDSSDLGQLISYIRGYASKLEAEKIRERTMRGRRAKAKLGQIVSGSHARLYGYTYIPVSQANGGKRIINENQAKWVREIFKWLTIERLSLHAITYRLRALNVPTFLGKGYWGKSSVRNIVTNIAYTGQTFAFTCTYSKPQHRINSDTKRKLTSIIMKPREEWVEIPGVTPPIIDTELFEAAQKQLRLNSQRSVRNTKHHYLLHGHIHCRQCGHAYWGYASIKNKGDRHYETRYYRCSGSRRIVIPINRCRNKTWPADKLEGLVWGQIESALNNPQLIISEIAKQQQDVDQLGVLETELQQVEHQLKRLDREQEQLLQWALKGFPEETIVSENKRINQERTTLQTQKAELEPQIKASQEAAISLPKLEHFVELMKDKLTSLDFETKRQVLDMLGIKVWVDGQNVEITGVLPVTDDAIATTPY
jgi:site-specific DNA recombinase